MLRPQGRRFGFLQRKSARCILLWAKNYLTQGWYRKSSVTWHSSTGEPTTRCSAFVL